MPHSPYPINTWVIMSSLQQKNCWIRKQTAPIKPLRCNTSTNFFCAKCAATSDTPSWPGYLTCHTTPTNGQSAKTTKLVDGLPVVVSVVVLVLTEVVVMVVAVDSAARSARTDSFQSFNHSNQSLRGGWANPGKKKLFSSHGVGPQNPTGWSFKM